MHKLYITLIIISLVIQIISITTRYWLYTYNEETGLTFYYGLYSGCVEGNSTKTCSDIAQGDIYKAVLYARGFFLLGLVGLMAALYSPIIGLSVAILCNIAVITIFFTKIASYFRKEGPSDKFIPGYSSILFFISTAINIFLLGKVLIK